MVLALFSFVSLFFSICPLCTGVKNLPMENQATKHIPSPEEFQNCATPVQLVLLPFWEVLQVVRI